MPTYIQEASNEEDDGVGLSYLNPATEDDPNRRSEEKRLSDSDSGLREDRKVRWGSVRDVDTELEKRYSEEIRKSHESTFLACVFFAFGANSWFHSEEVCISRSRSAESVTCVSQ